MINRILRFLKNRLLFKIFFKYLDIKNKYSEFQFKLDYPKKNIIMMVGSRLEYYRTQACKKEPGTVAYIEEYVSKDSIFYDIGANVGAYSLLASILNDKKISIYAFEPSFTTFLRLQQNILVNNCQNSIKAFMIPLSKETKITTFNYTSLDSGTSTHSVDKNINYLGQVFEPALIQSALSVSIDDFIYKFGAQCPNHIKIDVDGSEALILQGSINLLKDSRLKSIIVELSEDGNEGTVLDLLLENHFKIVKKNRHFDSNIFDYIFIRE